MANKAEALILKKTKQIADAAGKAIAPLGDMRLNKAGTVGTEPIQNVGDPQVRTEVKLGRFGAFQIPTKKDALNTVKKVASKATSAVLDSGETPAGTPLYQQRTTLRKGAKKLMNSFKSK